MHRNSSYLMLLSVITMSSSLSFSAGLALEEIFVTATKTDTTEQETPLSLESFTGDQLENTGMTDIQDLSALIPSVTIGEGQLGSTVNIRGMGSGVDRSFEQSVAMFIDGIYMPRSRQYRAPFFDMERVEVLRGPQALLYGLNATAGTITVNSATTLPGDERVLRLGGEYEIEYEGTSVSLVAGDTIGDNLGVRLAVRYSDDDEGYYENTTTGEDEGAQEESVVRLSFAWEANDDLTLIAKINWADVEQEGNIGESFAHNSTLFGSDGKLDWKRQTASAAFLDVLFGPGKELGFEQELLSVGVNMEYILDDHVINATVGYSESTFNSVLDAASLGTPYLVGAFEEDFEQISGEFRIGSDTDADFQYMAGIYIGFQENENPIRVGLTNVPIGASNGINEDYGNTSETDTYSPFVKLTYHLTDVFRVIGGVRYSHETKNSTRYANQCDVHLYDAVNDVFTVVASVIPTCVVTFLGKQDEITAENVMPEVIFQWDMNEDTITYAKAGRSVKSGAHSFSAILPTPESTSYDDEQATTFEVGYKTMLMERRLQLNAAIFYTVYEDLQVSSFVTTPGSSLPQSTITNAGESEAQGVEVEIDFAATEWLTTGVSLAYLDHEFVDYEYGPCGFGIPPDTDSNGDAILDVCNHDGKNVPFSPHFSSTLWGNVEAPITDTLLLTGGVTVAYSREYFTEGTLTSDVEQDEYARIDARIGVADSDGKWTLSLVGKNLESEVVISQGQSFGTAGTSFGTGIGYINPPKTIALQGKYNF